MHVPTYTGHSPNAVSMLCQRLRRWANTETALVECPVFAGIDIQLVKFPVITILPVLMLSYYIVITFFQTSHWFCIWTLLAVESYADAHASLSHAHHNHITGKAHLVNAGLMLDKHCSTTTVLSTTSVQFILFYLGSVRVAQTPPSAPGVISYQISQNVVAYIVPFRLEGAKLPLCKVAV